MICSQKQPVQLISIENFESNQVENDTICVSLAF